jgi:ABC-2 type transport system permease protein
MRNVWTIAKREFNMYFVSPVAYVVAFTLLFILGLLFAGYFRGAAAFGGSPDLVSWVLGPFTTLMLFVTPALTMRLMAEEQRTGTIELLLTAPVRDWEVVMGKWLAAVAFVSVMIMLTGVYGLILNNFSEPGLDLRAILVAYVGFFLMVAGILAVGVFVSTLFTNQIAAFFVTLAIMLALWIVSFVFQNETGTFAAIMNYLDFSGRYYDNFQQGVVDLTDLTYFVSVIALFLFLATRSVESRRWR